MLSNELTVCSETPVPGRSSVYHQGGPQTSVHMGSAPPSCRTDTPLHTVLDPTLGPSLVSLKEEKCTFTKTIK